MNKKKRIYHRLNMFYTLLLSTILPCVLATVLLGLVRLPMVKSVAESTDRAYGEVLRSSVGARMDRVLDMIGDQERQLLSYDGLTDLYFAHLMNKPVSFENKEETISLLGHMVASNPELYSVSFVLFESPDTLYSCAGVFEDLPFMQELSPNTLYYQFYALDDSEAGLETIEFGGTTYLLYHAPFAVHSGGQPKGVLNMLLRHETLGKELTDASENHAQRFVLLEDGEEVWTYGEEAEHVVPLSLALEDSDLTLSMSIPRQISTQTRRQVMPTTLLVLMLSLLVSLVLSYLLSRFTYKPIQTVVERFAQGKKTTGNELLALQQVFEKLLDEKSLAEDSLAHLRPMARQKLLSGLLDGTAFLEDSVEDQMHYCRVLFDYEYCNVIAVSLPFAQVSAESCTTDLVMETLTEHLCREIPIHAFVYSQDTDNFRILVNYDSWDYMQSFLSVLLSSCKEYFRGLELEQQVFLGVGQAVESPEDLYRAAEQAETAVNVAALNRLEQPMFYSEVAPELNYDYFYPVSEEVLLSRAIANCNTQTAKDLLYTIIEENKKKTGLNPKCLWRLYMDLSSTVARSGQSLGITLPPADIRESYISLEEIRQRVETTIDDICQQILVRRQKTMNSTEVQILAYIDQHLYDQDLSLNSIAERYHKSSAYISTLFKEQRGTNYNNYVNHHRIMRAVHLLTEEKLDVNTVYPMVGYVSLSTFRRNFNKYAKSNPGDIVGEE